MFPFALVVPTLNPGPRWAAWLAAVNVQTAKPLQVLVIDSSSDDGQIQPSSRDEFQLITIPRESFNHGATRQYAFEQVRDRVTAVIFMTQDAILADNMALERLLEAFRDPTIAAAFGRQLPHLDAGSFAIHSRLFNYGENSKVKQLADRDQMGLRTCFLSNSFAAYRCDDLKSIGGFPTTHFGEDMLVAARLLLDRKRIAYVAAACVQHSHDYSIQEEFWRHYAIGQFHAGHPWLLDDFGGVAKEGSRFAVSEVRYLLKCAPHLLPAAGIRTLAKYLGYKAGGRLRFTPPPHTTSPSNAL